MTDFELQLEPKPLPKIPLPQGWCNLTLIALLQIVTLARLAILNARNWPDFECDGLRLHADNDRLKCEVALLERELAIKDAQAQSALPLPCQLRFSEMTIPAANLKLNRVNKNS